MIGLPPACCRCHREAPDAGGQLWPALPDMWLCRYCWRLAGRWFGELPSDNVIALHPPAIDMAAVAPGTYRIDDAGELRPVVPDAE